MKMFYTNKPAEEGSVLSQLIERHNTPETRDIGVVGPVDGMNNLSAGGPYFRIVLMKGDNQKRSEYLISKGAAENLRDELRALLAPAVFR
jgi:hypothetical protein